MGAQHMSNHVPLVVESVVMITPQPELPKTMWRYLDLTNADLYSAEWQYLISSTIETCAQAHHLW